MLGWWTARTQALPEMDALDRAAHESLWWFRVGCIWSGIRKVSTDANGQEILVECDDPEAPGYVRMPQNCVTPGWSERQARQKLGGQQSAAEPDDFMEDF